MPPSGFYAVTFDRGLRLLIAALMAGQLLGCESGDMEDLKAYIAEVKGRTKGPIDPLPDVKVVEPFVFQPNTVNDPFAPEESMEPPEEVQVESGIRPDTLRAREELESFELDSLRMVGTVRQSGVEWALVGAVDGTIHRVKVGNYMGRNYGKVVNIQDNRIELVEIYADSSGVWRERKAAIGMSDTGEKP